MHGSYLAVSCGSLALLLASGCVVTDMARRPAPAPIPFDDVFELERTVTLIPADDDPIGSPVWAGEWNGDLVVVDGMMANLKLFAQDGRHLRTIGGAGDGPGEYRRPQLAATTPSGGMLIFDFAAQTVTTLSHDGEYAGRMQAPIPTMSAILPLDVGFLAAGQLREVFERTPPVSFTPLHRISASGHVHASVGEMRMEARPELRSNTHLLAALVGDTLVALANRTNSTLLLLHTGTGSQREVDASYPGYAEPARPQKRLDLASSVEWTNEQEWVTAVLALDDARLAVTFSRPLASATGMHVYSILDVQGRHLAHTAPDPRLLRSFGPGRYYRFELQEDGSARLQLFRFRGSSLLASGDLR